MRNYGDFLSELRQDFMGQTLCYGKAIAEEWCGKLITHFKVKVNVLVMDLL